MNASDVRAVVREFFAGALRQRDIGDADDIFALGFVSSMFAMQLVDFVEGRFGIVIGSADLTLENFRSIEAIGGLIGRKTTTGRSEGAVP